MLGLFSVLRTKSICRVDVSSHRVVQSCFRVPCFWNCHDHVQSCWKRPLVQYYSFELFRRSRRLCGNLPLRGILLSMILCMWSSLFSLALAIPLLGRLGFMLFLQFIVIKTNLQITGNYYLRVHWLIFIIDFSNIFVVTTCTEFS